MIRFREYAQLDEARRVSAATRAILGQKFKSYEKWLSRFATMPFPLSRTMMKRLQVGEKDVKALHSTDADGLKTLIDIQGTAKQISAFTELSDVESGEIAVEGIATTGGFVAEIVGDVAFTGSFDIFTGSDRQGRRWLDLKQFTTNKEIQASNPDFFTGYERGYRDIIRTHTEKIVYNNSIRKFFEDVEYYVLPTRIMSTLDWMIVFWAGGQGKKILNKTDKEALADKGIIHNLQAALRNVASKYDVESTEWKRIVKEHKKIERKLKQTIFQMTKELFDFAEEYLTENWIEFSMLGGDPRKTSASYNEVVMDSIRIKKIYVDANSVIHDSSTKNLGSKSKPYLDDVKKIVGSIKLKVMESSDWNSLFRKWVRR